MHTFFCSRISVVGVVVIVVAEVGFYREVRALFSVRHCDTSVSFLCTVLSGLINRLMRELLSPTCSGTLH